MTMIETWFGTLAFVFALFAVGKYLQVLEKKKQLESEQAERERITRRMEQALRRTTYEGSVRVESPSVIDAMFQDDPAVGRAKDMLDEARGLLYELQKRRA